MSKRASWTLKRMAYFLTAAISLIILGIGLFILVPRSYPVPDFTPSEAVAYWDLPSGSSIGYFHLSAMEPSGQPPIIFLHGGPGGMIYPKLIELLSPLAQAGYEVYLYDQVGSGHSGRLAAIEEYSVTRHREDLKEIVEEIGAEKVILFAHSWGTMLATEFYTTYPALVDRLIYSGPGPMLPINRGALASPAPDSLHLFEPQFSNRDANQQVNNLRSKAIRNWAYITGRKLASDEEADEFFTYLNGHLSQSTTCQGREEIAYQAGPGYYSHLMTVKSFGGVSNKRQVLRENPIPLLIIRGQCDNQAWGYTKEYLDLLPTAQLHIVEAAGHALQLSRRAEYLSVIMPFLSSELDP